jgi:hypothetical protein
MATINDEKERLKYAREAFDAYPDLYPKAMREDIIKGTVPLGMAPYAAYLAAGAFYYKVVADTAIWRSGTDPMQVMWAQTLKPDQSEIWMNFKNKTQFSSTQDIQFRVYFKNGRSIKIEKLN